MVTLKPQVIFFFFLGLDLITSSNPAFFFCFRFHKKSLLNMSKLGRLRVDLTICLEDPMDQEPLSNDNAVIRVAANQVLSLIKAGQS